MEIMDVDQFIGKTVAVCVSTIRMKRDGFHTQISVEGKLQKHPEKAEYRILVSDGTFVYFVPSFIDAIVCADGWTTNSGAQAVVFLNVAKK